MTSLIAPSLVCSQCCMPMPASSQAQQPMTAKVHPPRGCKALQASSRCYCLQASAGSPASTSSLTFQPGNGQLLQATRQQRSCIPCLPVHSGESSVAEGEKEAQPEAPAAWRTKALPCALLLAAAGAALGPPLDGLHSRVALLHYDAAPLQLGPLATSAWVFALLAAFYATVGPMHVALDAWVGRDDAATHRLLACGGTSAPRVALAWGVLALLLQLSAVLYADGVPYRQIGVVLAVAGLLNWRVFDGTRQGLALGALCALGSPAAELVLMNWLGLWHYAHPDLFGPLGLPSWVPWCYFFYTPALGNLARLIWRKL